MFLCSVNDLIVSVEREVNMAAFKAFERTKDLLNFSLKIPSLVPECSIYIEGLNYDGFRLDILMFSPIEHVRTTDIAR